jgi:hypothetical protein
MVGPFLAAVLFYPFKNWTILSGFKMVTISLVGWFILFGIEIVGNQMTGS